MKNKKIFFFFMLKSVLKCIEYIRIKNGLTNLIFFRANLGGGGGSGRVSQKPTF